MKEITYVSNFLRRFARNGSTVFGNIDDETQEEVLSHRRGYDDFNVTKLDAFLRENGYTVFRVPRSEIYEMAGTKNSPVAFRPYGSRTIYISRELGPEDALTAIYHEAGHDDENSEIGAQRAGMKVAESLGDYRSAMRMENQIENIRRVGLN